MEGARKWSELGVFIFSTNIPMNTGEPVGATKGVSQPSSSNDMSIK